MSKTILLLSAATCLLAGGSLLLTGCFGASDNGGGAGTGDNNRRASDAARSYPLDSLATATISVDGHDFRVWLAQEADTSRPGVVQEGLMHVPADEIEDDQGMLFVFSDERLRSFWMLNTITPLDIAFARYDGTIVKIWQMPPQTLQTFSSIEPAMFALEVKQGTFARLGIAEGDRLTIPDTVFKTAP
ncbi:MAG: DUF192 domain-containing protein [Phycisphaerae bacterium]